MLFDFILFSFASAEATANFALKVGLRWMASSRFIPSHWTGTDGVLVEVLLEELLLLLFVEVAALLDRRAEKSIPPPATEFVAGQDATTAFLPKNDEKSKLMSTLW